MMESYDSVYSKPEFYWGREPNRLCERALASLPVQSRPGARAVDLGCGEGRDLIHLARHGLDVLGVDLSRPGLRKAEAWAAQEGLKIRTVCNSLDRFRLTEPHDLVYSSGTLTFIPPEVRAVVFSNYRDWTRSGGINAFNVFVEKPYLPTPHDWGTDEFFFRSGELLAFYWDWEILQFEEVEFDCNSGGVPHRHAMDVLIAKRRV